MTLYTRRGDTGTTSLADGSKASKASARVEAYGTVDEAGALVGLARVGVSDELLGDVLRFVQHKLLACAGALASPGGTGAEAPSAVTATDVEALEHAIDTLEDRSGRFSGFVVESSDETATRLNVARAVVRRAERHAVALAEKGGVDPQVLSFLNRTSDTLFAAARYARALSGAAEEPWDPHARPPAC